MSLGAFIQARRESLGIKQEDLAFAAGMHTSALSQLENGKREKFPTPEQMRAIAATLAVTVNDLLIAAGYLDAPEQGEREETDDERLARFKREAEVHPDPLSRRLMLETIQLVETRAAMLRASEGGRMTSVSGV